MPALRLDPFEMKMPHGVVIPLKVTVCIFACVHAPFGLCSRDQSSDSARG